MFHFLVYKFSVHSFCVSISSIACLLLSLTVNISVFCNFTVTKDTLYYLRNQTWNIFRVNVHHECMENFKYISTKLTAIKWTNPNKHKRRYNIQNTRYRITKIFKHLRVGNVKWQKAYIITISHTTQEARRRLMIDTQNKSV